MRVKLWAQSETELKKQEDSPENLSGNCELGSLNWRQANLKIKLYLKTKRAKKNQ